VVLGSGDPNAELMFVGEAPGYHEDRLGIPFVGQAGKLLDKLLAGIGLTREEVFVANVLKCRPPGNRDPLAAEIEECEGHLFRQVGIIQPKLICTLGNFATKLISGRPDGISRVHGHELPIEIGGHSLLLYPLFHPAAALYTPSMLATLEVDFARIPELTGRTVSIPAPGATATAPAVTVEAEPITVAAPADALVGEPEQLGLF
jgi:DNA polymerase